MPSTALRVCILGHSGVGKSPVAKLFDVPGWEPFRVRDKPRNAEDAKVCKSKTEFAALQEAHKELVPLHPGPNSLKVYEDWTFFQIRGKDWQCLEHTADAKNPDKSLRIEIFAPVLLDLCKNHEKINKAFVLDPAHLVFIILNPTLDRFADMTEPSTALRQATLFAATERDRAQGKTPDLADGLKRTHHLSTELTAWRGLLTEYQASAVECLGWPHFEFRYHDAAGVSHARNELIRARATILDAAGNLRNRLEPHLKTQEQIVQLTDIV